MLVLLIEDNADLRSCVRDVLEDKGYRVLEAGNGEEGLRLAQERHPRIILLDLVMPGMSGFTVLEKIQGMGIPVIVITGHGDLLEQARRLGPAACMVKPVDPEELIGRIDRMIGTLQSTVSRTAAALQP